MWKRVLLKSLLSESNGTTWLWLHKDTIQRNNILFSITYYARWFLLSTRIVSHCLVVEKLLTQEIKKIGNGKKLLWCQLLTKGKIINACFVTCSWTNNKSTIYIWFKFNIIIIIILVHDKTSKKAKYELIRLLYRIKIIQGETEPASESEIEFPMMSLGMATSATTTPCYSLSILILKQILRWIHF